MKRKKSEKRASASFKANRNKAGFGPQNLARWQLAGKYLALFTVMAGVIWTWPRLMDWVNQPIARVEVRSGFNQLQRDEVEKVLAPWLVNRFLFLDLPGMQDAVAAMPWVKRVSVKREWPDKVVVTLVEREAIARWEQDGLIDERGQVFRPGQLDSFVDLPLLSGPQDRAQDVMQQYLSISQLLRPLGVTVSELNLSSTDSWLFRVDHVSVNIGRDRRMARLQRFIRLFHERLNDRWEDVKRVDLRYLNGASVAWK
nr:cell division protein FtsQ/DivIB [Endozoicomonas sp. OPT23]